MARRRRIAAVIAATALAAVTAPLTPASAHTTACAGTGSVTLGAGLYYALIGPEVSTTLDSLSLIGSNCGLTLSSPGSVSGWCGNSTGSVTVNDGTNDHSGSWTSAGSVVVLTGGISGVVNAQPAPGEDCMPGTTGADTFLIAGAAALT